MTYLHNNRVRLRGDGVLGVTLRNGGGVGALGANNSGGGGGNDERIIIIIMLQ